LLGFWISFRKKEIGTITKESRKIRTTGDTYLLDAFFCFQLKKKSGRFGEKSGKTQSSKVK
jgi:hypothetical protein